MAFQTGVVRLDPATGTTSLLIDLVTRFGVIGASWATLVEVPIPTAQEDTDITLPAINAALSDTDGSETLVLNLSGFPAGATFSKGALDAGSGDWIIDNPDGDHRSRHQSAHHDAAGGLQRQL